jgi:hypothetical protein
MLERGLGSAPRERQFAGVHLTRAELERDPKQLVVLRDAVAA